MNTQIENPLPEGVSCSAGLGGVAYVDRLRPCPRNPRWRHSHSCHLYALPGDEGALHALAARIGLRRAWYQGTSRSAPHYDLTEAKRAAVVAAGAREVTDEEMCEHLELWRKAHRQAREIILGEQRIQEERARFPEPPNDLKLSDASGVAQPVRKQRL